MQFGLSENIIEQLNKVFEENSKVDEVILFGSRAKGNYRDDSDIDLAVKGRNVSSEDILSLGVKLESLNLPYKIDLINYATIKDKDVVEHIDRAGIVFYEKWKKYKIRDIISLEYGKSLLDYRNENGEYDVYGTNGKIGTTGQSLYDKPSLVIGRKGAYREVHLSKRPFFVIDTAFYTKNKLKDLDTLFLYYWFKNIDINEMDSGSAIPSTSRDEVYDLKIKLPPLPDQQAISSTLSSLDDKIDLLHRQNKTLEQLAETLFRQWFVEEAEERWELGKIDDVVSVKGGTTPSTSKPEYWNGNIHWTSPRDLSNSDSIFLFDTDRKISEKGLAQIGSGLLPIGTVLLSSRAPIGYLTITEIPVAINQGYIAIICDKIVSNYFMFLWCKVNMNDIENAGNGSVFQEISKTSFKSLDILIPTKEKIKEFNEEIESTFKKMRANTIQIKSLTQLRNRLLPKLMSGEVKVKN